MKPAKDKASNNEQNSIFAKPKANKAKNKKQKKTESAKSQIEKRELEIMKIDGLPKENNNKKYRFPHELIIDSNNKDIEAISDISPKNDVTNMSQELDLSQDQSSVQSTWETTTQMTENM